jgi:hypothetical protein
MRVFFAGQLEELPRLQGVGLVGPGMLISRFNRGKFPVMGHGVWLRLERADGNAAALVWQKVKESDLFRLGWMEDGRLKWLAWIDPGDVESIQARLQISPATDTGGLRSPTWLEVEVRNKGVFAHKTAFFDGQAIAAWALYKEAWQGSALGLTDLLVAKPTMELPSNSYLWEQ